MAKGRPCAVERAYETMMPVDQEALRILITFPEFTGGYVADTLQAHGFQVDRMQVDHFRRKLRAGKATL